MTPDYDYGTQASYTLQLLLMFFLLCSYVIDMIKKLELCLLVVAILFKIGFAHAQISMPKISTIMLKIACINPCFHHPLFFLKIFV